MSYLTVKKFGRKGCLAYPHSTELLGLISDLTLKYLKDDIQVVTVSSFEGYPEYEPVTYVDRPNDLEKGIKEMLKVRNSREEKK